MISAIVPTRDRAELVARALASIEVQSRPADEVIVVDDGSTDGTRERIAAGFPAVRYLRQEPRGVSAARNRGIEAARGDWLAFLDSDDEWLPTKLERQLAALEAVAETGGAYRVCHTDEIWIRHGRRVNAGARHAKTGGWMFRDCLPLCAISPSSALIHRSVLEEVGGFDESLPACEDYDLWLRISARHPVLLVDEPLVVKHGGHADQLSRTVWGLDRFRIRALEKILESGDLAAADRQAALATLLEKTALFAAGAAKRGRTGEARRYGQLAARWRAEPPEAAMPAVAGPAGAGGSGPAGSSSRALDVRARRSADASEREAVETDASEREAVATDASEREAVETDASEREAVETDASEREAVEADASEREAVEID